MGRGGNGDGATGRGKQGSWQTGGGEEGARGGGGFHRWIEMLGWTYGMPGWNEITSFLTLFTRATPGTPASLY